MANEIPDTKPITQLIPSKAEIKRIIREYRERNPEDFRDDRTLWPIAVNAYLRGKPRELS